MYIKGVGMTKFSYSDEPWWKFAYKAAMEALEDADMRISDIDAIVLSAMSPPQASSQERQTHRISLLSDLFKTHVPIIQTPSVCSGGGVAFWTALKLGFKNILVIGGERVVDNVSEVTVDYILSASERVIEQAEGMLFPVQNALVWQQYMQKYEGTMDDLALVAFKNHQNAALNPKAYYYKRPVPLEKIKNSPVVASPLRLLDCSFSINGGAAVIISKEKTDVKVIGSGFATDYLLTFSREDLTHFLATKLAAEQAYKQAGFKSEDIDLTKEKKSSNGIDVAEIHDAFTSVELFSYEDLGFAPLGKGAKIIREGKVHLDGALPINPSGGLKAKGHPISVTGLAQIYEIVNQLKGRCGKRQVKNAKIGLCHNIGGTGGSVTVHIFKKIT